MKLFKNIKIAYILIMLVIDVIVNWALTKIFYLKTFAGVFAIVYVFLFVLLLYVIILYLKRSSSVYFGINVILAPLILYLLIIFSIGYEAHIQYEFDYLTVRQKKYQIQINKIPKTYKIYQVMNDDNTALNKIIEGNMAIRNDTTYLSTSAINHPIFIYKNILNGFPQVNDKVVLHRE